MALPQQRRRRASQGREFSVPGPLLPGLRRHAQRPDAAYGDLQIARRLSGSRRKPAQPSGPDRRNPHLRQFGRLAGGRTPLRAVGSPAGKSGSASESGTVRPGEILPLHRHLRAVQACETSQPDPFRSGTARKCPAGNADSPEQKTESGTHHLRRLGKRPRFPRHRPLLPAEISGQMVSGRSDRETLLGARHSGNPLGGHHPHHPSRTLVRNTSPQR